MTDHPSFDLLCDFVDAALAPAAEAAARTHLRSCEGCATRLSAISELATRTAALPGEMRPPDDLWGDILRELKPHTAVGRVGAPLLRLRHLAAAAIVIAAAASALTALVLRDSRSQPATAPALAVLPPPVPPAELPARLASAEHGYTRSVATLQRTLDARRDSLAPSTIATVERSLRIADWAIAEARDALARDPANRALVALFASNYERKIDLLRRATELAPRT